MKGNPVATEYVVLEIVRRDSMPRSGARQDGCVTALFSAVLEILAESAVRQEKENKESKLKGRVKLSPFSRYDLEYIKPEIHKMY